MTLHEDIKNILRREAGRPALINNATPPNMPSPPPAYIQHTIATQMSTNLNDIPEYDGDLSPVIIFISSPITIIGSSNLVAIDPDKTAINIAKAIASALKDTSMSGVGIPMIDEDGRPRPIEVRVDVGVKINGTKNTIGQQAVLSALQASFNAANRKREGAANSSMGLNVDKTKGIQEIVHTEDASASSTAKTDQGNTKETIEDAKK